MTCLIEVVGVVVVAELVEVVVVAAVLVVVDWVEARVLLAPLVRLRSRDKAEAFSTPLATLLPVQDLLFVVLLVVLPVGHVAYSTVAQPVNRQLYLAQLDRQRALPLERLLPQACSVRRVRQVRLLLAATRPIRH